MATKENLVHLMKELRRVLPGDPKKDGITYHVGPASIVPSYYCRWEPKEEQVKKAKECYPASVKVVINSDVVNDRWRQIHGESWRTYTGASKIFSPRTYQKRQDGTFNLEAIAAAVTKCQEAYDSWEKKELKYVADHKVAVKKRKELSEHLRKLLPSSMDVKPTAIGVHAEGKGELRDKIDIQYFGPHENEDETLFEVSIRGIPMSAALDLIQQAECHFTKNMGE